MKKQAKRQQWYGQRWVGIAIYKILTSGFPPPPHFNSSTLGAFFLSLFFCACLVNLSIVRLERYRCHVQTFFFFISFLLTVYTPHFPAPMGYIGKSHQFQFFFFLFHFLRFFRNLFHWSVITCPSRAYWRLFFRGWRTNLYFWTKFF